MSIKLNLELTNDVGEVASINPISGMEYSKSGTVTQIDISITETHITIFYSLDTGGKIREDIERK